MSSEHIKVQESGKLHLLNMNTFNSKPPIDSNDIFLVEKGEKIGQGDIGTINKYRFVYKESKSLYSRDLVVKQIRPIGYVDELSEEELVQEKQRVIRAIDEIVDLHTFCKNIGLPVPKTFRRLNEDSVVMTDLTENDEYYVHSSNNNPLTHYEEVETLELDDLLDQIFSIIEIATKNELDLNHDVLFFKWKNSGGKVDVILGDLDHVKRHVNFGYKYQSDQTVGNVYVSLYYFLQKFSKTDNFGEIIEYVKKRFVEKGYKYPF